MSDLQDCCDVNKNEVCDEKLEASEHVEVSARPKDRFYLITLLFFFLGLVHILPWNFFITANKYWMHKFRNTSINETNSEYRSELQSEFSAVVTMSLQLSNVTFMFLTMFIGQRFSLKLKLIGTLVLMLAFFVVATIFIYIDTDEWQTEFFAVTMLTVAAINAMNSIFGFAMYTVISHFPSRFLAIYMNGQGTASICSAILQIISLAIGMDIEISASIYFLLGIFVIFFTLVALILAEKNRFYLFNMEKHQDFKVKKPMSWKRIWWLEKQIWTSTFIVIFWQPTHNILSSIAPLVASEWEGQGDWPDTYFVPVATFFMIAIMDLVGRILSMKVKIRWNYNALPVISFVRALIVIPLLIFCNAQPRYYLSVVFNHDYQYHLIMVLYCITHGYLITIASLNIPKLVSADDKENAFQVYIVTLSTLIALSSPVNFFVVKML